MEGPYLLTANLLENPSVDARGKLSENEEKNEVPAQVKGRHHTENGTSGIPELLEGDRRHRDLDRPDRLPPLDRPNPRMQSGKRDG